jgi:hypothetical protein
VIKPMNNKNGIVSLEKIDGKRPKYVDWDTFDKAINRLETAIVDISKKLD